MGGAGWPRGPLSWFPSDGQSESEQTQCGGRGEGILPGAGATEEGVNVLTWHPHRALLTGDYGFFRAINIWPPFVLIGIYAASLSASMSNLIGASRILHALAKDDLFGEAESPPPCHHNPPPQLRVPRVGTCHFLSFSPQESFWLRQSEFPKGGTPGLQFSTPGPWCRYPLPSPPPYLPRGGRLLSAKMYKGKKTAWGRHRNCPVCATNIWSGLRLQDSVKDSLVFSV